MTNDELERAIQFLLNNQAAFDARQAAHDERLAALERLVKDLATNQLQLQAEFREGFEMLTNISEQTMKSVQLVAEAEARTIRRVGDLETRVDKLAQDSL